MVSSTTAVLGQAFATVSERRSFADYSLGVAAVLLFFKFDAGWCLSRMSAINRSLVMPFRPVLADFAFSQSFAPVRAMPGC